MKHKILHLIPGLIFTFMVAYLSEQIVQGIRPVIRLEALIVAISFSIMYGNTIGIHERLLSGIQFSSKYLIQAGVILLGVKLDFVQIVDLGPKIIMIVAMVVLIGQWLPMLLKRAFQVDTKLAVLLGVGSSICGAAAVTAMGRVIGAKKEDTAVATAVISILGAIGVMSYSFLIDVLPLTKIQYGIWAGSTLQGVSHSVGAAKAGGLEALGIGTVVKMSRVVMLAPIALILGHIFNEASEDGSRRVQFPMYILGFIAVGILKSFGLLPGALQDVMTNVSSYLILMAMLGIGLEVNLKEIGSRGLRAFGLGITIFAVISVVGITMIHFMVV